MWLQNTGLLDKLFIEVLSPPVEIPLKKLRVNEALDVQQLATAAIVMLAGIVVSSILFLGELCCGSPETTKVQYEEEEKIDDKIGRSPSVGWDE